MESLPPRGHESLHGAPGHGPGGGRGSVEPRALGLHAGRPKAPAITRTTERPKAPATTRTTERPKAPATTRTTGRPKAPATTRTTGRPKAPADPGLASSLSHHLCRASAPQEASPELRDLRDRGSYMQKPSLPSGRVEAKEAKEGWGAGCDCIGLSQKKNKKNYF